MKKHFPILKNNKKLVYLGIAIFLVVVTLPFWFNRGKAAPAPELVLTAKDASLLACVFVAGSGMLLGYAAARLAGLGPKQRQAVSLETGVQNAPLAIAVILATFPEAEQDPLLKLPFLYAMTALVMGTVATFLYRRFPST